MREIGVVRKRFSGDTESSKTLVGIARTQLGIMKNIMALGGLKQLSRKIEFADGTVMYVQSIFGQDAVSIFTLPIPNVDQSIEIIETSSIPEQELLTQTSILIVGYRVIGNIYHACMWKISTRQDSSGVEVAGSMIQETQDLSSTELAGATCISDLGDVIGGGDSLFSNFALQSLARWELNSELGQYVKTPFEVGNWGIVYGVSGDGLVVVGESGYSGYDGARRDAFWWSAETGVRFIPVSASKYPYASDKAFAASLDGKVIVGTMVTWGTYLSGGLGPVWVPFRWSEDTGTVAIVPPVAYTNVIFGQATDVSGDGSVVVGATNDSEVGAGIFRWTQETGCELISPGGNIGNSIYSGKIKCSSDGKSVAWGSTDGLLIWKSGGGVTVVSLPLGNYLVQGISWDGAVIVGSNGAFGRAFYWSEKSGLVYLESDGVISGAYDATVLSNIVI